VEFLSYFVEKTLANLEGVSLHKPERKQALMLIEQNHTHVVKILAPATVNM
jgi:hypothetical protein